MSVSFLAMTTEQKKRKGWGKKAQRKSWIFGKISGFCLMQYSCPTPLDELTARAIPAAGRMCSRIAEALQAPRSQTVRQLAVLSFDMKAKMSLRYLPSRLSVPQGSVVHENDPSLVY